MGIPKGGEIPPPPPAPLVFTHPATPDRWDPTQPAGSPPCLQAILNSTVVCMLLLVIKRLQPKCSCSGTCMRRVKYEKWPANPYQIIWRKILRKLFRMCSGYIVPRKLFRIFQNVFWVDFL